MNRKTEEEGLRLGSGTSPFSLSTESKTVWNVRKESGIERPRKTM